MIRNKIVFSKPHLGKSEINEVVKSLKSGWIGTGPKVKKFEENFKKYKNSKYAIAVNSCTAALHLSLLAVGIKKDDEVIVPTLTFAATVNTVIHAGAKPIFIDCEKDSMNINPDLIEQKITNKTKAILPVHLAGRMCNMDKITIIAKKYKLKVIEDCAHAIEAEYKGKQSGTFGDLGCFSFYATKNITTSEGGMIITNNKKYAEFVKTMSLHGMSQDAWDRHGNSKFRHYKITLPGYKYNMTDIQAAIGIHQLKKIDKYWKERQKTWNLYNKSFKDLPVITPANIEKNVKHAYHLYTLLLEIDKLNISRDDFIDKMTRKKIGTGVHYIPVHMQPYYKKVFNSKGLLNSEWISERTVSIPLSPFLKKNEIDYIIKTTKKIIKEAAI